MGHNDNVVSIRWGQREVWLWYLTLDKWNIYIYIYIYVCVCVLDHIVMFESHDCSLSPKWMLSIWEGVGRYKISFTSISNEIEIKVLIKLYVEIII